jgi:hypothetical protein
MCEIKRYYERQAIGAIMAEGNYADIFGWWDIIAEYFTA